MNIFIIPLVFFLDQWSKKKARESLYGKSPSYFLNEKISMSLVYNKGAFLGWLKDQPKWLHIFTVGTLIVLFVIGMPIWLSNRRLAGASIAFIIGGALGNYADRLQSGQVTDFIAFGPKHKVHYNLADFAIFFGAFLLILDELFS